MAGNRKIYTRIAHVEWMRNSPSGNPRARLHLTNGATVLTEPDAACNYGLENREYKGAVILTLNTKSQVIFVSQGCPTCEHLAHVGYCNAREMSGGANGIIQTCPCTTSTPGATA